MPANTKSRNWSLEYGSDAIPSEYSSTSALHPYHAHSGSFPKKFLQVGLFSGAGRTVSSSELRGRSGPGLQALEQLHTPKLILPAMTKNGTHVPIVARMNHPLEPKHYIRQIQFLNESDPIPSKGIFHPTPANGEIFFSFQARMHSGTSTLLAIAECNLHGQVDRPSAYHDPRRTRGLRDCRRRRNKLRLKKRFFRR